MSNQFNNLFGSIEELISKASETNQEIINETSKFIRNFDTSNLNREYITNLQRGIFTDAINKITELNVGYTTKLMDIGLDIARQLNKDNAPGNNGSSTVHTGPARSSVSAFTLKASGVPGGTAAMAFLLNSDKEDPILCKVQNTSYHLKEDNTVTANCTTEYTPQMFELRKGVAQRVDAKITIPKDAVPGVYHSRVTVAGFEHSHFHLVLHIAAAPAQTVDNATQPTKAETTETKTEAETTKTEEPIKDLSSHTVVELKQMAKAAGFSGYSKMLKAELIKLLR